MSERLDGIKIEFDKYERSNAYNLSSNDVEWLIEEAEKVETYVKALEDLEYCFEDFAKITGDKRFVKHIRMAKSRIII